MKKKYRIVKVLARHANSKETFEYFITQKRFLRFFYRAFNTETELTSIDGDIETKSIRFQSEEAALRGLVAKAWWHKKDKREVVDEFDTPETKRYSEVDS